MQNQGQNVQNQLANLTDMLSKFMSSNTASSSGSVILPSNTIANPKEELKGITTRSGVASQGPTIPTPPKVVKQGTEPVVAPVSAPMPNVKSSIPYPSRLDNERRRNQANEQIEKFYEIFKDMSFEISFTDALILMPKFASTLKALIRNKEKHRMDECLALADLGASINLMPYFVWEALSLPKLTSNCMTLELADRSVSKPIDIAKDVSFKVGVFQVLLILRRCFLKTGRALIDVNKGELTLHIRNEAITYNLDQTVRYSANYNQMMANKIDVIYEMYSQEVLGFFDTTVSGNPTPHDDPIVSTTSPTLTPFGDNDFLLFEEADAFLGLEDDSDLPKINPLYYDREGDILLLETIFNSEPLPPLPNHEQYIPSYKKELKVCEAKTVKSSVDEPPEVQLKDLPPYLEYAFLEGNNKLPVIIAKELGDEEKSALIKDYKPAVQHQRRINPKIYDVIKKEVEKLLDAGLIYPISDSPWVSPMVSLGIFKFPLTLVIRKRQRLPVPTERLPIDACLSAYAMHHALFKGYHFAKKDAKARLLWWVLLLQEFDYKVLDKKGAENLAADHLSRLENPYENVLDPKGINETFPLETLSMVTFCGDSSAPWFADFANYHAGNFIVKGENRASWSNKLDDALWVFRTAYKTPIGCTPYKLVYGKACHLPIELEHKAYWALKQANFDLTVAGD
uniref:Reverse transcriptase domain-containing protein n=1 Tax=Tanacetum cinerariifolium TaxID=118510 RepID=A0A6L2MYT5_TANCI|nr:reverse transcriptase domain-containing protein [Tanacetum cinerariifolium]